MFYYLDITANKEYNYEYEEGRIIRTTESDVTFNANEIVVSKTVVNTVKYYYDAEGKMTRKVITPASGSAHTVHYETNDDNTVVKFSAGGKMVTSHSKTDSFGRKVFDELQLGAGFVSRQFSYHAGEVTEEHRENDKLKSSATTQLVSRIILSDDRTLSYEYDAEERITKVIDSVDGVTEYAYDALGQLLTETVNGVVVNSMEYDNYGNIVKKNGIEYTYGDGAWKDLLTSYDGHTIEYDAQGNPTNYLGHELTWEKGRQLKSFDGNTYTYNANGIRTSKTVNGVKHTYTLDGTKILRETWGDNTLVPLYDNEDSVCGILYNDEPYYFVKNPQGDVIAIVDKDADTVARYSYDAWGVCTVDPDTTANEITAINPFRYRSYYFDREIGLYYLQSRYYDSGVGRFVNADDPNVLDGIYNECLYTNAFSFANNNPIMNDDAFGYLVIPRWVISFFVDLIVSLAGIGFLFAPIKHAASTMGKNALKSALKTPFTKIVKFLGGSISQILKFISKLVSKIPFVGGWIGKIITKQLQAKVTEALVGGAVSFFVNKMITTLIVNIDVLLSLGGLVGGIAELIFDKESLPLNGKIVI